MSPATCLEQLLGHRFFVRDETCLAIGNETDICSAGNVDYLIELLDLMQALPLRNPIVLTTKAPLSQALVDRIRREGALRVVFFLSYSGLGPEYEPHTSEEQLRANFGMVRRAGFPVVHFWRPLLPQNTSIETIRRMLEFAGEHADACVFVGMKLHPELSRALIDGEGLQLPPGAESRVGEWLPGELASTIYRESQRICPRLPVYRHSACAVAFVLSRSNHTATAFRGGICPQSQCPDSQRAICELHKVVPSGPAIRDVLNTIGRPLRFSRMESCVRVFGVVTQEEFAYLIHRLGCPIVADRIEMLNLYHGDIYSPVNPRPASDG